MNNPFGANRTKRDWHLSQDDLVLYADGEMLAKEATRTRDHLQACWTCRRKMHEIQETISALVDYLNGSFARNLDPPPRRWRTFRAQLGRVISGTSKPPAPSPLFAGLRRTFPILPASLRFAPALLAATFALLILLVLSRVPRVSANQLIEKAAQAQAQRIKAVPNPVVYQKLRVRRNSKAPVQGSSITWEVWNDERNDRFRQRVEDANGQRFIDPQPPDAAQPVSRWSPAVQPQREHNGQARARPAEPTTIPPILQELERILRANQMNPRRPLSAVSYESWRRSVPRDSEGVAGARLANGDKALTLTTSTTGPFALNAIVKAALVVRTEDWHPVEERLEVQVEEGVHDYELTEIAFEVVSLNNFNALVFAGLERRAPVARASLPLTAPPLRSPTDPELTAAEINARYALHRLRACVGESVEVSRDSTGRVEVRGVVETSERKQQLLAGLRGVAFVRVNIRSVTETGMAEPSPPESSSRSGKREEAVLAHQGDIVHVQSTRLPIEDQLRDYFAQNGAGASPAQEGGATMRAGIERQIIELSSQAVSLSLGASAEVGALRQLAENYPSARIREFDPTSRWLLEAMLRDHLAALRTHMEQSAALLRPVLFSCEKQNLAYRPSEGIGPPHLPDSGDLTWEAWTFRVFITVDHAERLTDFLFAGASLPARQTEAIRDLLADLNQMNDEIQRLQLSIDQNFSGGSQVANVTGQAR